MPQPTGISQLVVWKDLLIALTTADEIWILRGRNVWPSGTDRVPLEWVRVEAVVAPVPAPADAPVAGDAPRW